MPQMAGAGVLVKLLTDIPYNWSIVLVGVSMIVYVGFGGMIATTWVQIVNAVLILAAGAVILVMAMLKLKDRAVDQTEAKNGAK